MTFLSCLFSFFCCARSNFYRYRGPHLQVDPDSVFSFSTIELAPIINFWQSWSDHLQICVMVRSNVSEIQYVYSLFYAQQSLHASLFRPSRQSAASPSLKTPRSLSALRASSANPFVTHDRLVLLAVGGCLRSGDRGRVPDFAALLRDALPCQMCATQPIPKDFHRTERSGKCVLS